MTRSLFVIRFPSGVAITTTIQSKQRQCVEVSCRFSVFEAVGDNTNNTPTVEREMAADGCPGRTDSRVHKWTASIIPVLTQPVFSWWEYCFSTHPHTQYICTTVCIVFLSVILGAVLPLLMLYGGIDPAHSSTTIQVIMDILGVTITVCTFLETDHFDTLTHSHYLSHAHTHTHILLYGSSTFLECYWTPPRRLEHGLQNQWEPIHHKDETAAVCIETRSAKPAHRR
jgi:hypothetical protein